VVTWAELSGGAPGIDGVADVTLATAWPVAAFGCEACDAG
jgi:hypothetical protein